MSGTVLIAGLSAVGILLLLLFFKLSDGDNKKHFILQLVFLSFIMFVIVLIGKTSIDYQDNCSWLVTNSTTVGSLSSYNYAYTCNPTSNNTQSTFYQLTLWLMRITFVYLFLFMAVWIFDYFKTRGDR